MGHTVCPLSPYGVIEAIDMNSKLLFITTSLGTKWESYSQTLIELGYPSHKRILVDGTKNWSPLKFLPVALDQDSDYTIHIDEDCFLYDAHQLDKLISYMDQREDIVLAGTPDGGHYHRDHNPYACNLFFLIFKTQAIREVLSRNPAWSGLRFKESFKETADLDISLLDQSLLNYDDFEAYYAFSWSVIESGKKIAYLKATLNPTLMSTDIYFDGEVLPLVRHMWYLRSWFVAEPDIHLKVPHRQRYLALEKEIHLLFGKDPRFNRILRTHNYLRLIKSAGRRGSRKIIHLGKRILGDLKSPRP
jgi:hypothetical protein